MAGFAFPGITDARNLELLAIAPWQRLRFCLFGGIRVAMR